MKGASEGDPASALPLNKNQVCAAVCKSLNGKRFKDVRQLSTDERGVDVIGRRGKEWWLVEAKGGTSSKAGTSQFGKPYTASQVHASVGMAWFAPTKMRGEQSADYRVLMAFPSTPLFRKYVGQIGSATADLKIGVLWVEQDGTVSQASMRE